MKEILADLLWTEYHPMSLAGLPVGRRVTIARGSATQLVVFSPLRATEGAVNDLRRLGPITSFVLPNRVHDLFYEEYLELFAASNFLASTATMADHPTWRLSRIAADIPELRGFRYLVLAGMPRVQEHVFLHEESGTLILTDAMFNIPKAKNWFSRIMMLAGDIGGRPRPSRIFRMMIRSRREFASSLRAVLAWDFDRIMGGHGEIIEHDGKRVFQDAFREFLRKD